MRKPLPRLRDQSLGRLIPNALTILALAAGLTSIRYAIDRNWSMAVAAIVVAGILDGLDGRIARLLRGASRFGAELDSLSDFVSFGVAPAVLLHVWVLHALGRPGWVFAVLFGVCCALRLARFNAVPAAPDAPAWSARFFVGVPAPAGAGLALLPMFASLQFGPGFFDRPVFVAVATAAVALLMISRVPTYSFKRVRVRAHAIAPTLLCVTLLAASLLAMPWITLLGVGFAYLATIPFSLRAYSRLSAQRDEAKAETMIAGQP